MVELMPNTRTTKLSCYMVRSDFVPGRKVGLAILWWRTWSISICHTFANHVVPFLFGLAIQEPYHNHRHIVAANATRFAVRCKTIVHHVLADEVEFLLCGYTSSYKLDDRLRRLAVPDTWLKSVSLMADDIQFHGLTITSDD